ncbi:5-carboxymethyl-2-hydroxymuconate Delta-isomerase [Aquimarina sp. D1M17]|uniref:5-carboxymethyl-2-hydroxymuconate Delta-isomerase n=1 Tax=Aquimarina acroporae TaxID=2937283 RepID=UPI0020BD89C3|nr:5-carboxymethyl-2-hydroxymuconate Delta-isomerase [Aquimarina acroporae]MCK8522089.1 5-carboxymethyl-2-hydroxymuconate Delta-isomerase [Aquimarina acroporae]
MPHFILDCSERIIELKSPQEIIETVYNAAESTGLFAKGDIKVRINPFKYYTVGGTHQDFIHVFGNIMEGRTNEQKANLSKEIVTILKQMFPDVPILSINIRDFEKASYANKTMV